MAVHCDGEIVGKSGAGQVKGMGYNISLSYVKGRGGGYGNVGTVIASAAADVAYAARVASASALTCIRTAVCSAWLQAAARLTASSSDGLTDA